MPAHRLTHVHILVLVLVLVLVACGLLLCRLCTRFVVVLSRGSGAGGGYGVLSQSLEGASPLL